MSMLEGKISGMAAVEDLGHSKQTSGKLALLASEAISRLTGKSGASIRAYTVRPPLFSIPIGAFSEEHNP